VTGAIGPILGRPMVARLERKWREQVRLEPPEPTPTTELRSLLTRRCEKPKSTTLSELKLKKFPTMRGIFACG